MLISGGGGWHRGISGGYKGISGGGGVGWHRGISGGYKGISGRGGGSRGCKGPEASRGLLPLPWGCWMPAGCIARVDRHAVGAWARDTATVPL